jgi:hypothetical protein
VKERRPAGADLVIPGLALAFAVYFLLSIADLAWEAKANGVLIGVILLVLIAMQLGRIGLAVARGHDSLRADSLLEPREVLLRRLGLVAVTVLFIATINWLGVTLGLLLAMLAALRVSGVRSGKALFWIPLLVAASVYLLFIVALQSDLPHGPVEMLLAKLLS